MDKQAMADLIVGTYEHDLFKPFWLGNDKHSRLGYAFLQGQVPDHPLRRIAVLLHTDFQPNLAFLQAQEGGAWPQVLIAAPLIDRIASASYSLLGEEKAIEAAEAAPEAEVVDDNNNRRADKEKAVYQQIEEAWPPAVQNPFSRLPVWSGALGVGRLGAAKTPKSDSYQKGGDYVANSLRPRFLSLGNGSVGAPQSGQKFDVTVGAIANTTAAQQELLTKIYPLFAERTYPHANDTGLAAHTRLAANFYHLLLQNLEPQAMLANGTLDGIEGERLAEWLRFDALPIEIPPLLAANVVTIRLSGIEDRFLSAVRLDDLQGAKLLADRVRYALKQRIYGDLFGFGALPAMESCDGQALADLLCLSEDRFSLTYLIPAACGDEARLLQRLYELYQCSLEDVVDRDGPPIAADKGEGKATTAPLLVYLAADIGRALDDAGVADPAIRGALMPSREELLAGLRVILPAIGMAPVTIVAPVQGQIKPETIGQALVAAYRGAREQARGGQTPTAAAEALIAANGVDESDDTVICSASGASPAWTILADYAYGRNGKQVINGLDQYFHGSRTEEEELSQATVALRALAQGVAEAPLLKQFVATTALPDAKGSYPLRYQAASVGEGRLALPPFLEQKGAIKRGGGLVDLNAAYVRVRRERAVDGDPLIRFPSVSYGADGMGNVAMITLRPTEALYEDQHFTGDFMEQVVQGVTAWAGLQAYKDLRTYYFNGDAPIDGALRQELCRIPAHLARVLQRQQSVTTFFDRLPLRLEAAGVRVLTLEERFPVGRYLVPADQLTEALDVLDLALCLDLLGVHADDLGLDDGLAMTGIAQFNVNNGGKEEGQRERRQLLRGFLTAYVPHLLVGTTLLFKQKQALYLMLRAEQRLQHQVATQPVLAMGLADMRGTLIDRGQIHGEFGFGQWNELLAGTQHLDRRSLDGLVQDRLRAEHLGESEAMDAWVQDRWINRLSGADIKKRASRELWPMGSADEDAQEKAKVVHFLLRASRG